MTTTKNSNNRVVKGVRAFHYSCGYYDAGFAVWENGKICQGQWTKAEALEVLSHGGRVFSGHRNCPGMKADPFVRRALATWAKNWYWQVDEVYGPSSWTVDISVREGRVYADNVEIIPNEPGEIYYIPDNNYTMDA